MYRGKISDYSKIHIFHYRMAPKIFLLYQLNNKTGDLLGHFFLEYLFILFALINYRYADHKKPLR